MPAAHAVDLASDLLRQHAAIEEPTRFRLLGLEWEVLPGVYAPHLTQSAALYAEWLPYPVGGTFCEVGCGTGYLAVLAALRGCERVTALDISPEAAANARRNAELHDVTDRVRVESGDMFAPLGDGDEFDVIFWNSNFVDAPAGEGDVAQALFDPGYAAHRAFLRDAPAHLAPGGRLLLGFTDMGDHDRLEALAQEHGLAWRVLRAATTTAPQGNVQYELLELHPR